MSAEVDFRKEYVVCLKDRDAQYLAHTKEIDRLEKSNRECHVRIGEMETLTGAAYDEIRRLRAMVLRAHASPMLRSSYACPMQEVNQLAIRLRRAARLLTHWADAIEQGRVR